MKIKSNKSNSLTNPIYLHFSEKTIEKLKEHFSKVSVTINSKWKEVEERLKDDPVFSSAEPLEQIT